MTSNVSAQFCNVIPVPHELTSLEHVPYGKTNHLTLSEYGIYTPYFKPVKVKVTEEFGHSKEFIFDGFIASKVNNNPLIEVFNDAKETVLSLEIRLDGVPTITLTSQLSVCFNYNQLLI